MSEFLTTRLKQITGGLVITAAIGVGYVAGYQDSNGTAGPGLLKEVNAAQSGAAKKPMEWSPTQPFPVRTVYYPGTEALDPDEMRVIACGSGMPQPRLKQAAGCFIVELGNGDKFIFDMGEGSFERIMALGIPLDQLDKVFLGHLHLDHAGDFPAFYFTGPVNNSPTPGSNIFSRNRSLEIKKPEL